MTARIGTGTIHADGAVTCAWCDDDGAVRGMYLTFTSEATLRKGIAADGVHGFDLVITDEHDGDRDFDVVLPVDVLTLKMAVQDAGRVWAEAKDAERAAMSTLYAAIVAACGAGVTEVEAARLAGVDRMTVRRALGKL